MYATTRFSQITHSDAGLCCDFIIIDLDFDIYGNLTCSEDCVSVVYITILLFSIRQMDDLEDKWIIPIYLKCKKCSDPLIRQLLPKRSENAIMRFKQFATHMRTLEH